MELFTRTITIHQALAVVIIGVFLFAAAFSMTFGMQPDEHGNMSNCPFLSEQALVCPMGIFEHIVKWQQFSTIFLLFAFVLFIVFIRAPNASPLVLAFSPLILENKPETKLYNYLVMVFSRGILSPRLYA